MDHKRFDEIVKQLAAKPSRRSLLKSAAASALAFATAGKSALAVDRGPGVICRKNGDCDSNYCGAADFTGRRRCECLNPQVACGTKCVDPSTAYQSDKNNCGSCGKKCTGSNVCCKGSCVAPNTVCNGVCCTGTSFCYQNACCTPLTQEAACGQLCGTSASNGCGGQVQCPDCCVPEDKSVTCSNKCGPQTNNCDEPVDCGDCCTGTEGSCTTNDDCCSGVCVDGTCEAAVGSIGASCDDDDDCESGACCENLCVAADAYDSDPDNCGSCGNVCPGTNTECSTVTCTNKVCGKSYADSGTPLTSQTPGDCKKDVCDGAGEETTENDDTDLPTEGTTDCMVGTCTNGSPSLAPAELDAPCDEDGGSYCDGLGTCVECTVTGQCTSPDICLEYECCTPEDKSVTCENTCGSQTNNCGQTVDCGECCAGTEDPCDVDGDCCSGVCIDGTCAADQSNDGGVCDSNADCTSGECCDSICIADGAYDTDVDNCGSCGNVCSESTSQCTEDSCTGGTCGTTPVAINTACTESGGSYCDGAGACVACTTGTHCTSGKCESNNVCCVAEESSVTCNNKCGSQTNNCGQSVSCGTCCGTGQRKSANGDYCVPDAATCATFKSGATVSGTSGNVKDFRECDFSGQTIVPAAANYCNFTGANFSGATMTSIALQYSTLTNANFSGATLTSFDVRFGTLAGANFSSAKIVSWAWAPTTCPDSTGIASGNCCSHMNGNTPTSCP